MNPSPHKSRTLLTKVAWASLAIAALTMYLTGCTLLVCEESYGYSSDLKTHRMRDDPGWALIGIEGVQEAKTVIPGIYKKRIYQIEPYVLAVTVGGDFDEITALDVELIEDETTRISIEIDLEQLNESRAFIRTWEDYSFDAEDIPLAIRWKDIEILKATVRFVAKKDGIESVHETEINFRRHHSRDFFPGIAEMTTIFIH